MNPIVVKLGGRGVDAAIAREPILDALVALWAREQVVLVHGGGDAVDARLSRMGHETRRVRGLRVTDRAAIAEVVGAVAGVVSQGLVGALASRDVACAGLTLTGAGLRCRVHGPVDGVDLGRVGLVVSGEDRERADGAGEAGRGEAGRGEAGEGSDTKALEALLGAGVMPVVSCVGADDDGEPLNVNADDAAAGVAAALGARQLVLLTDTPGVLDGRGAPIDRLDGPRADALLASGVIEGGMAPKVRAALAMAAALHSPVRIASWRDTDAPWWADPSAGGGTVLVHGRRQGGEDDGE